MRDESFFLQDIIEAAGDIEEIVGGLTKEQFLASKTIRWAVIQRLGVIGKAVAKLSDPLKARYPDVEWDRIKGARNIFLFMLTSKSTGA